MGRDGFSWNQMGMRWEIEIMHRKGFTSEDGNEEMVVGKLI